jgi:hypothetical protein
MLDAGSNPGPARHGSSPALSDSDDDLFKESLSDRGEEFMLHYMNDCTRREQD